MRLLPKNHKLRSPLLKKLRKKFLPKNQQRSLWKSQRKRRLLSSMLLRRLLQMNRQPRSLLPKKFLLKS
jgi:phosphopantetheinyl transferase